MARALEPTVAELAEMARLRAIRGNVLAALGRPPALDHITVTQIFQEWFRVNVYIQEKARGDVYLSRRIGHSYFLRADENGEILGSVPRVERVYV